MKPKMIIPMLVCRNAAEEIDFCKQVFNAVELSRRSANDASVIQATLMIDETLVMVHNEASHLASSAPLLDGSSSVVIYLYGDEVDAVIERAVTAGAKILQAAADQCWGDRVGRIIDPAGHVWNIATRINDE